VLVTTLALLLGGIGLFLLGMSMMTDGLKLAAGDALRRLLDSWTRSAPRGLAAGFLITAIVQSSSAVTVATVGFVNAGLLTLSQSIWVIFGTNVGTTMTGWLVALVGVKLDISALALPLIGAGMLVRLTAGRRARQVGAGQALAGFGVFFLGISVLQSGFADLAAQQAGLDLGDADWVAAIAAVGLGIGLTILTQSSSAAIAIILTASAGAGLPLLLAAAAVIGTSIGTTSTALLAALSATPAAKRVASAHIVFNLATGLLALACLMPLLYVARHLAGLLGAGAEAPAILAVFHTLYKVLGVALIWPVAQHLVRFLETRFVTPVERLAQPRHLDPTLISVPALALRGLVLESSRMLELTFQLARRRIETLPAHGRGQEQEQAGLLQLGQAIRHFIGQVGASALPKEVVEALPDLLRAIQHLEDLAEASDDFVRPDAAVLATAEPNWNLLRSATLDAVAPLAESAAAEALGNPMLRADGAYQQVKAALLGATAIGRLPVREMEAALAQAHTLRRCAETAVKAQRRLAPWIARLDSQGGATPTEAPDPPAASQGGKGLISGT